MKILVVDDSSDDRELIRRYLKKSDPMIEVLEADSLEEGLVITRLEQPPIVLLDYHLTDGTAEEFLEKLDRVQGHQFTEVVVITGQDDPRKSNHVLNNGAIDYLTKGMITATTLPVIVRTLMEKSLLKRELDHQRGEIESFTRRVAHDLNGVLGSIIGTAWLVGHAETMEEVRQKAEALQSAVMQARRIIEGLYELSQIDKAKADQHTDVHIEELVAEAASGNREKFGNARLLLDCPHRIPCVKSLFPQVFQNLIANTVKFAGRSDVEISVRSVANDTHVYITYEDNGPGIPGSIRDRLFEAFEASHQAGQEGLGLGMHIVKRILDFHKGTIQIAEPKLLSGAAFEMVLPIGKTGELGYEVGQEVAHSPRD